MPERKRARKGDKKEKDVAKGHNFPVRRPLPGAWPPRDVSAPCRRRPRPRVVKSRGALVAAGSVGPRSLGGCESLGLWPPAQPAPAAGQGGNCRETRRLSGRVVQGRGSGTRGGGSHAPLRARGLSSSVLLGTDLPPPGEREKPRGRPPLLAHVLRGRDSIQRHLPPVNPENPVQSPGST